MNGWSRARVLPALRTWLLLMALFVVVAVLIEFVLDRGQARMATEFMILAAIVVGMQAFVGNSGVLSFGHVSFFAVGAYVTGLVTMAPAQKEKLLPGLPGWLSSLELGLAGAVVLSIVGVAIFAAFTGAPLSRMNHSVAPMATLALLVMTYTVLNLWDSVTRGARGLVGVPNLVSSWIVLATAGLITLAALLFAASPSGLRLQAVREDPVAAAALGIKVAWARFVGWMVSAVLMSVGATVWALNSLAFAPEQFFFAQTFALLSMLIIGGMGSVTGAVVGTALVSVVSELLRGAERGFSIGPIHTGELPGLIQLVVATTILVVLIWRPTGLFGQRELADLLPGRRGRQGGNG